jgi:hypothetical protein
MGLKEQEGGFDSSGSEQGPVAGSCKHDNELWGSKTYWEFLLLFSNIPMARSDIMCYVSFRTSLTSSYFTVIH